MSRMLNDTPLTRLLGLDLAIVQAPMAGGPTTPELVAAVSGAGALGSLGAAGLDGETILKDCAAIRALTDAPFNVNLFIIDDGVRDDEQIARAHHALQPIRDALGIATPPTPNRFKPSFGDQIEAVLEAKPAVFSFTFGCAEETLIERMKSAGVKVIGSATTVDEGRRLVEAGIDIVCAQGSEAGGHRGTFIGEFEQAMVGTMVLTPQLADALDVPVIAAGGIMDGAGIAAALALGAAGAQLGTAFLRCPESGAHPAYKAAIAEAGEGDTRVTRTFSGRPARGIVNRFMDEMAAHEDDLPPYPVQNALTGDIRAAAAKQNRPEFMSLWAGQGVAMARDLPAAEVVRLLAEETQAALGALG